MAAATMRELVLDVDDAELVADLRIEGVREAVGGVLISFGIVEDHHARVDVADAVGILHRRDQVRAFGILE